MLVRPGFFLSYELVICMYLQLYLLECLYKLDFQIDFPLPIVASNIIIQFSDFYDNLQVRTEPILVSTVSAGV